MHAVFGSGPFVDDWAVQADEAEHGFGGPRVKLQRQKRMLRSRVREEALAVLPARPTSRGRSRAARPELPPPGATCDATKNREDRGQITTRR